MTRSPRPRRTRASSCNSCRRAAPRSGAPPRRLRCDESRGRRQALEVAKRRWPTSDGGVSAPGDRPGPGACDLPAVRHPEPVATERLRHRYARATGACSSAEERRTSNPLVGGSNPSRRIGKGTGNSTFSASPRCQGQCWPQGRWCQRWCSWSQGVSELAWHEDNDVMNRGQLICEPPQDTGAQIESVVGDPALRVGADPRHRRLRSYSFSKRKRRLG